MHLSFGHFYYVLTGDGLASGFGYKDHQRLIQMTPLSDQLGELRKCRTGMRFLTMLVCMTSQMLQDHSDCKSTDLARVCCWTRG